MTDAEPTPLTWAILAGLGGLVGWAALEFGALPYWMGKKLAIIEEAQAFAKARGKSVLNVGCCNLEAVDRTDPLGLRPPPVRSAGDVNVDIRHEGVEMIDGKIHMRGDIFALPFGDKVFGAAIASHVLEHIDDPDRAVAELLRVSDAVFVALPEWWLPSMWLYGDHKWVFFTDRVDGPRLRIRP